jgi:hypothetical protein
MKSVSKFFYFLFRKEHKIIGNKKLFRFQSELAKFAVTVDGCSFYKKTANGIRPFINQQLKPEGDLNSKPLKNHRDTYSLIVKSRVKQINQDLTEEDLHLFLVEFSEYFSKDPVKLKEKNFVLFDQITAGLLDSLRIVAIASGGSLTEKEFMSALKNLKQKL